MRSGTLACGALLLLLVVGHPVAQAGTPQSAAKVERPAPTAANCAQYVREDPPYDYSYVPKNAWFSKTWYIKNCGTATWTTSWGVHKISGNVCSSFNFSKNTGPGSEIAVWVSCYLGTASQYQARFRVKTPAGVTFGDEFWFVVNTF